MTEETKTGDPDLLATWPNSLKVAELDNVCTVKKEFLTTGKVTIKWRHNLADKTENYYQLAATNTSQNNTQFYLFVAESKLRDFENLNTTKESGHVITFKVTKDFLYGEKKDKPKGASEKVSQNRFLVYQVDDSIHNGIYQHRFIKASWETWRNMLSGFVNAQLTGKEEYAFFSKMLDTLLGDKLLHYD